MGLTGCQDMVSTLSRPKAAGRKVAPKLSARQFQHSAARRRLMAALMTDNPSECFNTQPPEGG